MIIPEKPRSILGPRPVPRRIEMPEPISYRLKRRFLGPPLVTDRLGEQRLGKFVALGVLSPDCISSTAYGSEEMLTILVPAVGVAAFALLLPVTLAVLLILFFVTLSYREVVTAYTKAGGSYVVARENFGPKTAQVAAVALIIDYIVTVAVQTAAGTDAVTSAFPVLAPYKVALTVGVVGLLWWGNLRGIKEAGRTFAIPTYLFIAGTGTVVAFGLVRMALGQLHAHTIHLSGAVGAGKPGNGLLMGAGLFIVLRAFANGGSSLTGLEAISNGVASFRAPEGVNARRVLVIMSVTLGSLVMGVSLLAWKTHAVPYALGSPTVLSQEATYVFGHSTAGRVAYYFVQGATMLILYTGANTSFNGFPNLVSFVAQDSYLPPGLTRRGHRLAFSNGIMILAVASIVLLLVSRAQVSALVGVYAIGVFTGFAMAGAGMVRHHLAGRRTGWRRRTFINGFASVLSLLVVMIFAVTKFTQGAWVVVVLFPVLVYVLIRFHRTYAEEAAELEENVQKAAEGPVLRRHIVLVFVERFDLAVARTLQYARSLSPADARAVHFVLDTTVSRNLEAEWVKIGLSRFPLEIVECPDRRIGRATMQLVAELVSDGETEVTVLLPTRMLATGIRRLFHDRRSDRLAALVSEIPNAAATIIPFRLGGRRRAHLPWDLAPRSGRERIIDAGDGASESRELGEIDPILVPDQLPGTTAIGQLQWRQRARVVGRVHSLRVQPAAGVSSLEAAILDRTGQLLVVFQGRRLVPGVEPGARLLVEGMVGERGGRTAMINPAYTILASGAQDDAGTTN